MAPMLNPIGLLTEYLRSNLRSDILTPSDPGYKEIIFRWSETIKNHAAIVVLATSAKDISLTIRACCQWEVPFAVAGGRHTTSNGSSCDKGLVIDLREMRRVCVDPELKCVRVQGGCIWKDVDSALAPHGLAAVGGTVNDTGVGGLALGGGYGWLSGRHGLIIDNLVGVQMVMADGSNRFVSRKDHPELFWALQGAGQCFGVAVEFGLRVHEQRNPVWAGLLGFPLSDLEAVFNFANELVERTDGDSAMMVAISTYPFSNGELAIVAPVFHNGNAESGTSIFQPLLDLNPSINTVSQRPYVEVNQMMNVNGGGRNVSKGAAFTTPLRPEFVRETLVPQMRHLQTLIPDSRKTMIQFEFYKPDAWCKVPVTATAHGHRGYVQNVMIHPHWRNVDDDGVAERWSREVAGLVVHERINHGTAGPITEYGNYDHLSANPVQVYGLNYDGLVEVKKQYDPNNVFNKWYSLVDEQQSL
ncbi:hypothetical protein BDW59DRAFT_179375 [Aspergillus cavernicola]|uniref:FAD-binding PCMH-type domain-containing protein n=1 Tax=Aspergillus cavernicola TaxID=176166 RepID=A0ABR4IIH7_9EURO